MNRLLGLLNALGGLGVAVWISATYIDREDDTCGSVFAPTGSCSGVLVARGVWSIVLVVSATVAAVECWRSKARPAWLLLAVSFAVTTVSLIVNEIIRSDGALELYR